MSELYEMSVQKLTEKLEKAEKELAVAVIENADLRERLSSLESLYRVRDKDCTAKDAELERLVEALSESLKGIEIPSMTPARAEYFKAGVHAAVNRLNTVLADYQQGGDE